MTELIKKAKADMFNRKASDPKNRPDLILETLSLQPGQTIADIGSGGGYFSLRFADEVGKEGKVYSVDTDTELLEVIRADAQEKGLTNLETIPATESRPPLPEKSLDLIFMRNVYHHLPDRVAYFRNLAGVLKPKGKLAIIEHKEGGSFFSFRRLFGHNTPKETIIKEVKEAGYRLLKDHDILPEQHFLVFSLE